MIKMKNLYYLIISCLLMISIFSCSDDSNTIATGKTYPFEGVYSGTTLDVTLDGTSVQNVTATITMTDDDTVGIKLTGLVEESPVWYIDIEDDDQWEWSGDYAYSDARKITYTVSFSDLYGTAKCKIVCRTVD